MECIGNTSIFCCENSNIPTKYSRIKCAPKVTARLVSILVRNLWSGRCHNSSLPALWLGTFLHPWKREERCSFQKQAKIHALQMLIIPLRLLVLRKCLKRVLKTFIYYLNGWLLNPSSITLWLSFQEINWTCNILCTAIHRQTQAEPNSQCKQFSRYSWCFWQCALISNTCSTCQPPFLKLVSHHFARQFSQ